MRLIGNILWLVLGGLAIAFGWAVVGVILCITIIGIPMGRQAFKMAKLTLTPLAHRWYTAGAGSAILNFIWPSSWACGSPSAILAGVTNCITIIGIPFGLQSFMMAKLALFPLARRSCDARRPSVAVRVQVGVVEPEIMPDLVHGLRDLHRAHGGWSIRAHAAHGRS